MQARLFMGCFGYQSVQSFHQSSFFFIPQNVRTPYSLCWCMPVYLHVYFAYRTRRKTASIVVPRVRISRPDMHARLSAQIIRSSWVPVGVGHCRHRITVCIGGCHSPDECGLTTRVNTLSSRPIEDSIWRLLIASR